MTDIVEQLMERETAIRAHHEMRTGRKMPSPMTLEGIAAEEILRLRSLLEWRTIDDGALKDFEALRLDVEQFDDFPPAGDGGLFSDKVPLALKSYLVNWLRRFMAEHGDEVQKALTSHLPSPPQGEGK